VVFAYAKHIEAYLISERDCFEQLAEMSRRIDGPTGRVNGCRYETVYANLHLFIILVSRHVLFHVTNRRLNPCASIFSAMRTPILATWL
jgi:hypothetical protein